MHSVVCVQGAALKYISTVIGDVMTVFDPVELRYAVLAVVCM
jgi:hypothetical protein